MVCCKICLSLDQLSTNCVICSAGHIKQERELYISLLFTSEINFRELPSKSLCIEVSLLRGILVLIIHLCSIIIHQLSLFFQYYVVYYRYKILLVFFGHFICLCFSCLTKCLFIVTVFPPPLSCQLQKRKRREYLSLKSYENVFPNSFFVSLCCRDRVSRPTSVFDRNGYDPFARARRSSLSKKSKMKQMKQQVAPSIVKQTDYSQVHDR